LMMEVDCSLVHFDTGEYEFSINTFFEYKLMFKSKTTKNSLIHILFINK